jgi:hypothetical protein
LLRSEHFPVLQSLSSLLNRTLYFVFGSHGIRPWGRQNGYDPFYIHVANSEFSTCCYLIFYNSCGWKCGVK